MATHRRRTTTRHGQHGWKARGTELARSTAGAEGWLASSERALVEGLRRAPRLASLAAGAGLLALAMAVGGTEIAVAAGGAYIVMRILRDRESPARAAREVS